MIKKNIFKDAMGTAKVCLMTFFLKNIENKLLNVQACVDSGIEKLSGTSWLKYGFC